MLGLRRLCCLRITSTLYVHFMNKLYMTTTLLRVSEKTPTYIIIHGVLYKTNYE